MKQAKDFLERLQHDEAFLKEVGEKVQAKIDAGETEYNAIWGSIAVEYGYEVTEEELNSWRNINTVELSEEEMGKVAGGTSPLIAVSSILITGVTSLFSLTYSLNSTESPDDPHPDEGKPYGPL